MSLIQQPPDLTEVELDIAAERADTDEAALQAHCGAPPFDPDDPDGSKRKAAAEAEAEAKEQAKYDAEERRRKTAQDNVRREREQAEISGTLAPDAELFYETLRAKVAEAHDFQPTVRIPIVQGLFNGNSLSWVAGSSGTFKSFMTADLAFRYGSGDMDYHGRKMTHGRALIIVAEGDGSYADRKTAWERQYQREVKNVAIYPGALQLADIKRDMAALLYFLRVEEEAGQPFGLIIVDTQAMCTVGIDENSSEMNLVVNVLHRIRQTSGACVMPVHHFGKDASKGMRGSTVVYAAADTVLVLKRDKDAMDVDLSTAQSDGGKQKDNANESDFMRLEMKVIDAVNEDYFGDPVSSLVAVPADAGHDVTDVDEDVPEYLPDVTVDQMFYLKLLAFYEARGATPADMVARLEETRGPMKNGRQNIRNRMIELAKMKPALAHQPKERGPWVITQMGVAAIARELAVGDRWVELSGPRKQVSRQVSEGQRNLGDETCET